MGDIRRARAIDFDCWGKRLVYFNTRYRSEVASFSCDNGTCNKISVVRLELDFCGSCLGL